MTRFHTTSRALATLLALAFVASACPEPEPEPEPPTPALEAGPIHGLDIVRVTINQAVEIPLFDAEALDAERNAPVVAGRDALVRVFVDPDMYWADRDVRAVLTLTPPDGPPVVVEMVTRISGDSEADDRDSTFDLLVDGTDLVAGTLAAIALWEAEPREADDGEPSAWPIDGLHDLRVDDWGGVVRVLVVPVQYDADGSGRLPDTSPEQLDLLREWLEQLYPVHTVELTIDEVLPTDIVFESDGSGFGDLLSWLRDVRDERGVPWDTYYYALISPRETRQEFCSLGCTLGLSYLVTNPNNSRLKSSVGVGWTGDGTAQVMAHEVGHAHALSHAPCGGAGGPDPAYPYSDGSTGVWGWDVQQDELVDPDQHYDVMGYCEPRWISDFSYSKLHQRIAAIEGLQGSHEAREPEPWVTVDLAFDGAARVAPVRWFRFVPEGEAWSIRLLDDAGAVLGSTTGSFVPFGHGPGGVVVLPAPPDGVRGLLLPDGRALSL
jgi:hypothetical protein